MPLKTTFWGYSNRKKLRNSQEYFNISYLTPFALISNFSSSFALLSIRLHSGHTAALVPRSDIQQAYSIPCLSINQAEFFFLTNEE
jgi:hypothetical protein